MRARRRKSAGRSTVAVSPAGASPINTTVPPEAIMPSACANVCEPADDVEDEVDRPGLRMRRPEVRGLLELRRVDVDRANLRGAGDARALNHRKPYRTTADHSDARALPDVRRLEDAHHSGRNRAADQACLIGRQLGRDLHGRDGGDDSARREGPCAQDGCKDGTVRAMQPPRRRRRPLALARNATRAGCADAARGMPPENDAIALRRDPRRSRRPARRCLPLRARATPAACVPSRPPG